MSVKSTSDYLTTSAVARKLGCSRTMVCHWIASRELAAVNISRGTSRVIWRVHRDALAEFIRRRSNGRAKAQREARR